MLKRTIQIVDDWQPASRHVSRLLSPYPLEIPGAPLAQVVRVRQSAPPLLIENLDLLPQVSDDRGGILILTARLGLLRPAGLRTGDAGIVPRRWRMPVIVRAGDRPSLPGHVTPGW